MLIIRAVVGCLLLSALSVGALDILRAQDQPAGFAPTTVADLWDKAHSASLEAARDWATRSAPWNDLFQSLLDLPAWVFLSSAAIVLLVLAALVRRPRTAPSSDADIAAHRHQSSESSSELGAWLASCRGVFTGIALISAVSNVLMLTGSFFMLEIYDRVLPSRSIPTLVALAVLAGILFTAQGLLDFIRGRLLVRTGTILDETLGPRIYDVAAQLPLRIGNRQDAPQPVRDLDSIRTFLSSAGPVALFDIPWLFMYLGIIYLFHPLLGIVAASGALVLIVLTVITEIRTRRPIRRTTEYAISRHRFVEASSRNAEVLAALGLRHRLGRRWSDINRAYVYEQRRVNDVSGGLGAIARIMRLMLQSGVLAVGAYLVIVQEATAGIIIAGAILTARALAPLDLAIAHWNGWVRARQSWQRLNGLLAQVPVLATPMQLPSPTDSLAVESVSAVPPGEQRIVMHDVTFALKRGQGLAVIGPSGSGKSSLARTLVGIWLPARGRISLDRAAFDQWPPEDLARHIGYLPQGVELFSGTVAENICRFADDAQPPTILKAAQAANVHDLIVSLPRGYETQIGEGGAALSPGQQQRVALARALYGDPFLVVLDEPDSNLDTEGQQALRQAIMGVRARGGIVVVISHRRNVLAGVDLLLAMQKGRMLAIGPKEVVIQKLQAATGASIQPLKVVPETGGSKT